MEKIDVEINISFSDGQATVHKTAQWVDGTVLSGYGTGEVLSKEGAWEIKDGLRGQGWIYLHPDTLCVLEDNVEGNRGYSVSKR